MEFVHSPLARDCHQIRLLLLELNSNSIQDIYCTLHHVNLDDKPSYKALSYAWGDPHVKVPIYINQKQYGVTASCHAALLRLREIAEEDGRNDQTSD